ncbi:hypothetical protein [Roseicella aerolata]|uniref:Uncharacterized protein n=1 Tax=Roseicella aerolata TaxID=2883479 RepID=A0A9X1IJK9_9PROT|nr:hypothetical protein [Roseicella aerolata]MCB4825344.1 hypothetical protein [Roseicella aerolata]
MVGFRQFCLLFFESHRLQLSPEDIAAAEACGVTFQPATPAQVQRLAMQRKVFYAAGQPILATRGDGFYETAGTLQQLIEEGVQQQRDLAAWQQSEASSATGAMEPDPQLQAEAEAKAGEDVRAEVTVAVDHEAPPRPTRRRRQRPAMSTDPRPAPPAFVAPLTKPQTVAESAEAEKPVGRATMRSPQPGQRWLVAGAVRRGRAAQHWSNRQR